MATVLALLGSPSRTALLAEHTAAITYAPCATCQRHHRSPRTPPILPHPAP
ncbi:hypothetical protein [Streptomyces sp. Wb2n-11]|uniref:hypothetical protein n=1 Tax=Streptomyces sp. Wb2n-11 TaxID=1030533 RepID=UPI000AA6E9ED|nr:hypothetical protein [Streptomyces sp. Wb2n-11]